MNSPSLFRSGLKNPINDKLSCAYRDLFYFHISVSGASSSGRIVPALGELWSHCVTNRVMLQPLEYDDPKGGGGGRGGHDGGYGMGIQVWDKVCSCALVKSPSRPLQGGQYKLCGDGIRDVGTAVSVAGTMTTSSSMSLGVVGGEGVHSSQMGETESSRKRPYQG